jgi:hypothetical protein
VGRLLGPGGSHIKALQDLLRIKMGITDALPGPPGAQRYLTIHGPPAALRVAVDVVTYATRSADSDAGGISGDLSTALASAWAAAGEPAAADAPPAQECAC